MKTLTINMPDNIDVDEKELSIMLASQLYDKGSWRINIFFINEKQ